MKLNPRKKLEKYVRIIVVKLSDIMKVIDSITKNQAETKPAKKRRKRRAKNQDD